MYSCTVSPRLSFAVSAQDLGLERDLTDVISQSIFDIARLVEAYRHQRFDPLLRSRPADRSHACVPPSGELDIRRQAGVNETLRAGDRPFVEPGDPGRERLYNAARIGA